MSPTRTYGTNWCSTEVSRFSRGHSSAPRCFEPWLLLKSTVKPAGRPCICLRRMEPRRLEGLSDDAFPYCVENHFRPAVEVQFLHDVTAMCLHRVQTQIEKGRDLFIAPALAPQFQSLPLPGAQQIVAVLDLPLVHLADV